MILNLFLKSSNQQFEVHLFILNMLKHYMLLVHIFSFFCFSAGIKTYFNTIKLKRQSEEN